jgi:hypothetical protein
LFVDGGDTNAGVAVALDSSSNGGWGVYDSSFLGNTYVGAHTATNALGGYKSDGLSARNMFLNCYAESDQNPTEIRPPSMVVGGLLDIGRTDVDGEFNTPALLGTGGRATFLENVEALNTRGSSNVSSRLGSNALGNTAFEFVHSGESSWPWSMTFDDTDSWWKMRWAGLSAEVGYALSVNATAEGRGQFWLPNGTWLGSSAAKTKLQAVTIGSTRGVEVTMGLGGNSYFMSWASAPPASGTFNAGDIVWNDTSSSTTGWRFDGSSWNPF